jgi:hypothetical protein
MRYPQVRVREFYLLDSKPLKNQKETPDYLSYILRQNYLLSCGKKSGFDVYVLMG